MECQHCGAALRPGARFCNSCGARQELDSAQHATDAVATDTGVGEASPETAASSGRAKRPPRIPRADAGDAPPRSRETAGPILTDLLDVPDAGAVLAPHAEDDVPTLPEAPVDAIGMEPAEETRAQSGDTNASGELADDTTPVDQTQAVGASMAVDAAAGADGTEHTTEPEASSRSTAGAVDATDGDMGSQAAAPEQPAATDWTEAETAEYSTILATGRSLDAGGGAFGPVAGMPPLEELARTHGAQTLEAAQQATAASWRDGMPWPLPPSIIVGGRYRVESVISTMPEGRDAENVYRVHDLQGYEHCWSCGTEHGPSAATDTFCQECGADMLARDYLMSERLLAEEEADTSAREHEHEHDHEHEHTSDDEAATEVDTRLFVQGSRLYRVTPLVAETPLFPRGARITGAAATDTGVSRAGEVNEDSLGLVILDLAHESRSEPFALAIVADGLGGHDNGQAASRLVVQRLSDRILRSAALPFVGEPRAATHDGFESLALAALREGIEDGNVALCEQNVASGADMGSTLVTLLVFGTTAYIANVGDSRAYVLDDGDGLRRITTDHSLVEQLVAAGEITPEERYTHPQRNQILRSIGDERNVAADVFQQHLRPGMRFLLCSDGLWEMVRDEEIEHILRDASGPQQACDLLTQAANANGGEDNITAIVVEVSA